MQSTRESTSRDLTITPWPDSLVERLGHEPRSDYVEMYWLPVIGPSATWLYRRLGVWVTHTDELTIDVDDVARSIGIGGKGNPVRRTLDRLVTFHAARWNDSVLEVRRALPTLPRRNVAQLPTSLQIRHERDLTLRSCERLVPA
jgi:hypothetical protein